MATQRPQKRRRRKGGKRGVREKSGGLERGKGKRKRRREKWRGRKEEDQDHRGEEKQALLDGERRKKMLFFLHLQGQAVLRCRV